MNAYFAHIAILAWAVWTVSWMAAVLWRSRLTKRAPGSSYRGHLYLVFIGFLLLFERWSGSPPLWTVGPVAGWALVGAVVAGFAFAWWARIHLGALWSGSIETHEGHRVVDSGPYGLVRHPIYTGIILSAFGLAFLRATPLALTGAVLFAIGFALKAKVEERFLSEELPDYPDYARRVPMLVPGLRFG